MNYGRKMFPIMAAAMTLAMSPISRAQTNAGAAASSAVKADDRLWSIRMTNAFLSRHPHYVNYDTFMSWNYEEGLMLRAIWKVWKETGEKEYFDYVRRSVDSYVTNEGTIKTYNPREFRLDDITPGNAVLSLYKATKEEKYKRAAFLLRKQMEEQPRNKDGGFWHKEIYPNQMWLNGFYMAEPFYARFAQMFNQPGDYEDIVDQFILMAKHARDPKTGLFYHAWDASKKQKWANPITGDSPTFWGRSMGWYMMGLVDVLDYFPKENPQRDSLVSIFKGLASSLMNYQDRKTGLWYQVVNKPQLNGNYLESSASAMFTYAFAKGAEKGYLGGKYLSAARKAFAGLIKYEIRFDRNGEPVLMNTCGGTGLGGTPYRDGSYEYYLSVPKHDNDFKVIGAFVVAALEIEKADSHNANKVVCLDCYHNNEWRPDRDGREIRNHYIWEDSENTGYSELGGVIEKLGAQWRCTCASCQ